MFVSEDEGVKISTDRKFPGFQLKTAVSTSCPVTRQGHKIKVVFLNLGYKASYTNLRETPASTELAAVCTTSKFLQEC